MSSTPDRSLPLLYRTPDRWAQTALSDVLKLLSDHAYLERKAASNALELLNRWPAPTCPEKWVITLSTIARDEALHLHQTVRLLKKRQGTLDRLHRSRYASDLHRFVRRGLGKQEILDRLLVSAVIEARSCERFDILGRLCPDEELAAFYRGLYASEKGHFTVFLGLAEHVLPNDVASRWQEMLTAEAWVIENQPAGPGIHSGCNGPNV